MACHLELHFKPSTAAQIVASLTSVDHRRIAKHIGLGFVAGRESDPDLLTTTAIAQGVASKAVSEVITSKVARTGPVAFEAVASKLAFRVVGISFTALEASKSAAAAFEATAIDTEAAIGTS